MSLITNIIKLFVFEKKIKLVLMFFFVLLVTFLEAFGIALIFPAVLIITDGNTSNVFFNFFDNLTNYFGFSNTTLFFLVFFLAIYIIKFFVSVLCVFFQYNFAFNFYKNISAKIYKSYLSKKFLDHINLKSSDLIRKISSDIDQATINSVLPLFTLVTEITIMFGIFLYLLFLNLKLTLFVFFVTSTLVFLYFLVTHKRTDYWAKIRLNSDTSKINLMQQSFITINEIKILSAEKLMEKKFDQYNDNASKAYKFQATILESSKYFIEVAGITMFVLLVLIFYEKINTDFIGLISVYAASAFRFLPSINRLIVASQKIRYAGPSVKELLFEIDNLINKKEDVLNGSDIITFDKKLEFKNINFNFSKNIIMKNLNLTINKYDKIGIKGPSGSGKSTFLYILSGLIKPHSGEIFADGNIVNLENKNWYKKIGYTPQFINLIDDTIKENITYGLNLNDKRKTDNDLSSISKVCLLDEFLNKTSNGLESVVGENGIKLSGGQKQRIGISRTLFRDPEILILDESTSSLDLDLEKSLLKNIFSYGVKKTIVIVSHKETTLEYCDKVFNFENYQFNQVK